MQHFLTKKSLKNFLKFFLNGVFSYWFFVLYIRAMITFHVCISCVHFMCMAAIGLCNHRFIRNHKWFVYHHKKRSKKFFKNFLIWCFFISLFALIY